MDTDSPSATAPPPFAAAPSPSTTDNIAQQFFTMMAAFLANYSATATSPAHAPPRNSFLPPGIKAPTIDFFDGKQQKSVRPWLQRTRSIVKLMGLDLDSPNCVTFVSPFLAGPAQTWLSSEADRATYGMADSPGSSSVSVSTASASYSARQSPAACRSASPSSR